MAVEEFQVDGCAWRVETDCGGLSGRTQAEKDRAVSLAVHTLRQLTAYRLASCPVTVRPCTARCSGLSAAAPFNPHVTSEGQWVNACGCSPSWCSCTELSEIRLDGPVAEVSEVLEDGSVLPASAYGIVGDRLVRFDGKKWPACQDLSATTGEGTLLVTYRVGVMPSSDTEWALGMLASEFAKACSGGEKCNLPRGVQRVARQGISYELASGAFPGGLTGIQVVDAYITTLNPNALKSPPRVWSPDFRTQPRVR